MLILLLIGVGYAVLTGDFLAEFNTMSTMPWLLITLLDIYVGFILFSMWVCWREQNALLALAICAAIMMLGNIASCLYVLYAVHGAGGSMHKLMNGHG